MSSIIDNISSQEGRYSLWDYNTSPNLITSGNYTANGFFIIQNGFSGTIDDVVNPVAGTSIYFDNIDSRWKVSGGGGTSIDTYTKTEIDTKLSDKVNTTDIVDNLTSSSTLYPLSANQGMILNNSIQEKIITQEGISYLDVETQQALQLTNQPSIFADGQPATYDTNNINGWHYEQLATPTIPILTNKINWYFYPLFGESGKTMAELQSMFLDLRVYSTQSLPWIVVYTKPQLDGNDAQVWYRSKFNYNTNIETKHINSDYTFFAKEDPQNSNFKKFEFTNSGGEGPQLDNEEILYITIHTNSIATEGQVNFTLRQFGFKINETWTTYNTYSLSDANKIRINNVPTNYTSTNKTLEENIKGIDTSIGDIYSKIANNNTFIANVETFADLTTVQNPQEGDVAYVKTATGIFPFKKTNGIYKYTSSTWTRIGDLESLATRIDNNANNKLDKGTPITAGTKTKVSYNEYGQIYEGSDAYSNEILHTPSGDMVSTDVQDAINELNNKKINLTDISANIKLFPTNTVGDFGYNRMVASLDDPDYNTTAVNISTGVINTDNQLVGALIADAGLFIGTIPNINVPTIGNIAKIAGNNNEYASFYFSIFKRDVGGTETLVATSNNTDAVNPLDANYREFSANAIMNNTWVDTDRVVIKYYATLLGNPGAEYYFQFGGSNPVRTELAIPINLIPVSASYWNNLLNIPTNLIQIGNINANDNDYIQKKSGAFTNKAPDEVLAELVVNKTLETLVKLAKNATNANKVLQTNSLGEAVFSNTTVQQLSTLNDINTGTSVQSQLNGKQAVISGTNSRVIIKDSSGAITSSVITTTELGFLSGASSNIQVQLNDINSRTFPDLWNFDLTNSATGDVNYDDHFIIFGSGSLSIGQASIFASIPFAPSLTEAKKLLASKQDEIHRWLTSYGGENDNTFDQLANSNYVGGGLFSNSAQRNIGSLGSGQTDVDETGEGAVATEYFIVPFARDLSYIYFFTVCYSIVSSGYIPSLGNKTVRVYNGGDGSGLAAPTGSISSNMSTLASTRWLSTITATASISIVVKCRFKTKIN